MKLFAVIDRKAKQVVSVFSSVNDESAKRSFLMLLTGPQNLFTDFPEDFDLFPVADISYSGVLTVSASGNDDLKANGFKVQAFDVFEPLTCGSSFDKRYLKMLHDDRFPVEPSSIPESIPESN